MRFSFGRMAVCRASRPLWAGLVPAGMDGSGRIQFFPGPSDTALVRPGVQESLRTAVRGAAPIEGEDD
jgi:hypothetical protein